MFEIVGREEQVFEQWEQGVTLSNPCMKAGHEVVFRNSSGATYVMIAREESGAVVCDVPNKLLQMCCNILVDLEQGNDRHTECRTTFTVNPAQKPDGYKCVDNSVPDNRISFNDLKDKPFYDETEVLFDEMVEFFEYGNDSYSYGEVTGVSLGLVEGNKYRVNFDGVEFESAATFLDDGDVQLLMLTSSESGEADEYYSVLEVIGKEMMSYECAPPRATATIKIESTKVKTIDPKFIPAGVGGGVVIVQDSAMASGVMPAGQAAPTATMNAAQIAEAVFAGKTVYFLDSNEDMLLPFEMGYRFSELRSGVMMAGGLPDPFAQFGFVNEYGEHHIVKVYLDGSYERIIYQFQQAMD